MATGLHTCIACGIKNAPYRSVCLSCGGALSISKVAIEAASEPTSETPLLKWVNRTAKNLTVKQALKLGFISATLLVCLSVLLVWQRQGQLPGTAGKPTYEVTIPGQGTFTVESPRELSDTKAIQAVMQGLVQESKPRVLMPQAPRANLTEPGTLPMPQPRTLKASGAIGCQDGYWISSKTDDGEIIVSNDGSVWQVDSVDTVIASLWLPFDNIIICGDTMINTDDKEKILVTRLQ